MGVGFRVRGLGLNGEFGFKAVLRFHDQRSCVMPSGEDDNDDDNDSSDKFMRRPRPSQPTV